MAVQILDARNPNEVSSPSVIAGADLGAGGRSLAVLSGIAIVDWKYNSDVTWHGQTEINLGMFASNIEQWSVFVGLASVSSKGPEYVFAADTTSLGLRDTGELFLHIDTALMGTWGYLGRISYQVVATLVRVHPYIAGTISWDSGLFAPASLDPSLLGGAISVYANSVVEIPPGPSSFGSTILTPLSPPGTIFKIARQGDSFVASYRIDGPPLAKPLRVSVVSSPPFPSYAGAGLTSGPLDFTLTAATPSLDNENFQIYGSQLR